MRRTKGQSLSEYGVVAALVAVIAVPALITMGNNLNAIMKGMLPMDKAKAAAMTASAGTGLSAPLQVNATIPTASGAATSPVSQSVMIRSTADLINSVQTAGVNGATTQLASTLTETAKKLLDSGQIDQAAYNDIIALANQGHHLADIESSIMSAAKAAGDGGGTGYYNSSALLDGQSYSGPALADMLQTSGTDVTTFQQLMNKVLQSSTVDSATRTTISQLSTNILNLASASATSSDWMQQDGGGVNTYESFLNDLPDLIGDYSKTTKTNSNNICGTQNNTKACTQ